MLNTHVGAVTKWIMSSRYQRRYISGLEPEVPVTVWNGRRDQIKRRQLKNKKPTRCHLLFYVSGTTMPIIRRSRLWCWVANWSYFSLQPGHYSSLIARNFQPTANQERNDQCGNQYYSCELLMMGIVVPETRWACKKYRVSHSLPNPAFH